MREAETALGWPARAGKLVLTVALDRLAGYYRWAEGGLTPTGPHPEVHVMILYGSSLSPFVRKVMVFAARRGSSSSSCRSASAIRIPISARRARSARCRRLPDGDYGLADLSAIIHYLEAKRPRRR